MNHETTISNPLVAIDIGTTKICVLVGKASSDTALEIIGIGQAPCEGLKKGVVVNINKTINALKSAIKKAEIMADCSLEKAVIGISGSHIQSLRAHGSVPIQGTTVTRYDINNVLAHAQAITIPEGQKILHVIPHFYTLDGQERVIDPFGMHGVRLDVQVHIITASVAAMQNLIHCCKAAHIEVTDVVLEHLGSGLAVLSPDERELGVGIIDIGGGTTDVAVFHQNSIIFTHVVPLAGNHFTNDLALCLRITLPEAERIKKEYSLLNALPETICAEAIEKGTFKNISYYELDEIIRPRTHELLSFANTVFEKYALKQCMPSGIVLTGGGSLLDGITDAAQEILQMPVRLGRPQYAQSSANHVEHPLYATGYGLLLYSLTKQMNGNIAKHYPSFLSRIGTTMKKWLPESLHK